MGITKDEAVKSLAGVAGDDKKIKSLVAMLEACGETLLTELLTQWSVQDFVENNTITPLGQKYKEIMSKLHPIPKIYYILLLVEHLSKHLPDCQVQYDAACAAIKKYALWPKTQTKLLNSVHDILQGMLNADKKIQDVAYNYILQIVNKKAADLDINTAQLLTITFFTDPRPASEEDVLKSTAEQLDDIKRVPDSEEDKRICGLILSLSDLTEHVADNISRLCAIEFIAGNYQRTNIIDTLTRNLARLEPKPAIYYALDFLEKTQNSTSEWTSVVHQQIHQAIHHFATWPYDIATFTSQLGNIFKGILNSDEVGSLLDPGLGSYDAVYMMVRELDNLDEAPNKESALLSLNQHFPAHKTEPTLKFPAPSIRSQANRVNEYITRKLRTLLEEFGCDYVKVNWSIDISDAKDSSAFREIINAVSHLRLTSEIIAELAKRGIKIHSTELPPHVAEEISVRLAIHGFITTINNNRVEISSIETLNDAEEIINDHQIAQVKLPSSTKKPQEIDEPFNAQNLTSDTANFVNNIDIARQMSTAALAQVPELQDVFVGVDESSDKSTGIVQQVFAGMLLVSKIQQDELAAEDLSLYTLNTVENGLDLFRQFAPELFKATFKKTPFGSIFIAGRQLANELFFARDWQRGRDKHHEARFSVGERCEYFAKLYQAIYVFLISQIREKIATLRTLLGKDDIDINTLLKHQDNLPPDAIKLLHEIARLSNSIETAKSSIEALIKETRKEASRLNVEQQVLMTSKHIDRVFNAVMIGLGVGTVFVPIMGIPAAALALTKNLADTKVKAKIKSAVEIVQGIYETDNTVSLNKNTVKQAIKKMGNLTDVVLQYSPPVIVAFKLTRSYEKTVKEIRQHPEYILHIPDALKYKNLDSYAKPTEIKEQMEAFLLTCQQFQYHMQIILGKTDIDLDDPNAYDAIVHQTPRIHNIGALKSLIQEWSINLQQRLRDQRLTPDSLMQLRNFTEAKQSEIARLSELATIFCQNYEAQFATEKKDIAFLEQLCKSIEDELSTLEKVLAKAQNHTILNGNAIILRLQDRLDYLNKLCQANSDLTIDSPVILWQRQLKYQLSLLKNKLNSKEIKLAKDHVSVKHLEHAVSTQEHININELGLNLGPGVKASAKPHITIPVHHYRAFESRRNANLLFSRQLANKSQGQYTELYLQPVDKVTQGYLHKAGFWKNIWLVRGINRAVEFVENIAKRTSIASPNIVPMNVADVLMDYKAQLELIRDHDRTHLSKFGSKMINSRAEKAINNIDRILRTIAENHPQRLARN